MSKAFTIIEILISVSILAVLFTFSIGQLRDSTDLEKLDSQAALFIETLNFARKSVDAGYKPATCGTYAGRFSVNWNVNGYTLTPVGCDSLKNYTFPSGIVIINGPNAIVFKPFGAGLESDTNVVIKNNATGNCVQITVSISGNINKAQISCP